jgi:hypothetical protein
MIKRDKYDFLFPLYIIDTAHDELAETYLSQREIYVITLIRF